MADLMQMEKWAREFLKAEEFEEDDSCWNGVQVETEVDVKKVVGGVTPFWELIEKAVEKKANLILVHHGFFGKKVFTVRGRRMKIMRTLIENKIGLMGFHLPLDAHPEIGNNAVLAKMLGLQNLKKWVVGFIGELPKEIKTEDVAKVFEKEGIKIRGMVAERKGVKRVAVISGGANFLLKDESLWFGEKPFDLFITGDVSEHRMMEAKEMGFDYLALGHDASEKEGVKNLGKMMAEKFGVEFEFVDVKNNF